MLLCLPFFDTHPSGKPLYPYREHMQFVVLSSIWFLAIPLLLLMLCCCCCCCWMPEQADTFLILWWMCAIIFAIYAKVDSVVINGSPTKQRPPASLAQYAHISNSISLLCECGSTFNLYLVHTHTHTDRERQARTQRDKCIDQNVWQHVLVPIRLTSVRTHTHAHISQYILYGAICAYDISVCAG